MRLRGYHACKTDGGKAFVEQAGPFPTDREGYLGKGHYLWEGILDDAKWWGGRRYSRRGLRYFIMHCIIEFDEGIYLDLLGSLEDKEEMIRLMEDAGNLGYPETTIDLGTFIDWLRKIDNDEPGFFPFTVIRCQDDAREDRYSVEFLPNKGKFVDLRPRILICFHRKDDVTLIERKVVHLG